MNYGAKPINLCPNQKELDVVQLSPPFKIFSTSIISCYEFSGNIDKLSSKKFGTGDEV
jgi:hypothetical protein